MPTTQPDGSLAFSFEECAQADLFVDALYLRGPNKQDDPTARLTTAKSSGGFRPRGSAPRYRLMVMYTTLRDPAWPDHLDLETGLFVYHGDVKKPGIPLNGVETRADGSVKTVKLGNRHLEYIFVNRDPQERASVCPHFVFESIKGAKAKEIGVRFRGLVAPGHPDVAPERELVAEWRHLEGVRFQNYRAHFCVLDEQIIKRQWLTAVIDGNALGEHCPLAWRRWVETGKFSRLNAVPTGKTRTKSEQQPKDAEGKRVLSTIRAYYNGDPYAFEHCAIALARLADPNILSLERTRSYKDGGIDATGLYRIGSGLATEAHVVAFSVQAKCYAEDSPVVTSDMSRLIGRLTHRQFGMMITTSYVHPQAYGELKADGHPVIVISAREIAELLRARGIVTSAATKAWLDQIHG